MRIWSRGKHHINFSTFKVHRSVGVTHKIRTCPIGGEEIFHPSINEAKSVLSSSRRKNLDDQESRGIVSRSSGSRNCNWTSGGVLVRVGGVLPCPDLSPEVGGCLGFKSASSCFFPSAEVRPFVKI